MTKTGHGERRYIKRRPSALPPMIVDGVDLGPAMRPQDILIWTRLLLALEDREIVQVMRDGAGRLSDDPEALPDLDPAQIDLAISQAAEVTPSRVDAWRRRNREMTWLELRVLFVGLRETL